MCCLRYSWTNSFMLHSSASLPARLGAQMLRVQASPFMSPWTSPTSLHHSAQVLSFLICIVFPFSASMSYERHMKVAIALAYLSLVLKSHKCHHPWGAFSNPPPLFCGPGSQLPAAVCTCVVILWGLACLLQGGGGHRDQLCWPLLLPAQQWMVPEAAWRKVC